MLPVVARTLAGCKTREESVRKDEEREQLSATATDQNDAASCIDPCSYSSTNVIRMLHAISDVTASAFHQ